jgi:hypothetical protein
MSRATEKITFLSLPIELRLEIVAYALEQPHAGLIREHELHENPSFFELDKGYKHSANLAIRLVCRQFNAEFRRLAIQTTLFMLPNGSACVADSQSDELLREVRKLRICCEYKDIADWRQYPLNKQCMHLDELDFVMPLHTFANRTALVGLLRRLRNVKQVKILFPGRYLAREPLEYIVFIGELLKEDHHQRYDAPNAPNLESTWWDWSCRHDFGWAILAAQEPKPIMVEEDYMLLMKPKVDYIVEYMAS